MTSRIEMLRQQTEIMTDHCTDCPINDPSNHSNCGGCEHFNRLRNIGNALLEESAERRRKRTKLPEPEFKFNISTRQYRHFKRLGWADKKIAAKHKMSTATLVKFKRKFGLTI